MKVHTKNHKTGNDKISRRKFITNTAAVAAFTIVPRHVLGGPGYTAPSDKLNIAGVGIGGMGKGNLRKCSDENIVALCDVDYKLAAPVFATYPKAAKYRDYRIMLEKQKDIDAVIVATPDHTHAPIAMAAMQMGKHVYVQKPLTHTIYEARMLAEAARKYKVVTQMGNQGHSSEVIRLVHEWINDGAIGGVREVHCWTKAAGWSHERLKPKDTPPAPAGLDWDLWLGPAPYRTYHPWYHPGLWRSWYDFGTGILGDMGCHIMDAPFWALNLGAPVSVQASHDLSADNTQTYPKTSIVRYKFAARGNMPPVELIWYGGGLKPPRPEELEPGRKMGSKGGGSLFIGDKGKLMCGNPAGGSARLIPETKMREYKRPAKTLARVKGHHAQDWVRACKAGEQPSANFDYAGPLTEMVLLGNLAGRFNNQKIEWDSKNMKVTNIPAANEFVHRQYRKGWKL